MDAVDLRPETVNLVSGGDVLVIPSEEARIGDVLLVRPGDRIPLDGVIIEGSSQLDTSPITGEPVPVKAETGDSILSGCVNTSGQLKIRVEKELSESMVTRILDSVENAAASKPVIDRFITRFARIYTPFVVILALVTAFLPSLITGDWQHSDLHCAHLPGHELSMRSCSQCTSGILFRDRRGFQKRDPVQRRNFT